MRALLVLEVEMCVKSRFWLIADAAIVRAKW